MSTPKSAKPAAPKTAREIIQAARDLLADPARWTQGAYARSAAKRMVTPNSRRAASFCLVGSLVHVTDPTVRGPVEFPIDSPYYEAVGLVIDHVTGPITVFTAQHTHAEVLTVLDNTLADLPPDTD